jgi:gamma-glutamyl:cysteine ligase YbdK (ATP-grasp superfamily)
LPQGQSLMPTPGVEFSPQNVDNRFCRLGIRLSEGDRLLDRRAGLEQEFFLVEESGRPSKRADEFLEMCQAMTEAESGSAACFAPEFVLSLVEVNTSPVYNLSDLEREYARNLQTALRTASALGLRLYPLGTYPLPLRPVTRDGLDYRVQVGTVGSERFVDAGRCAGTHLHLELQPGTVDTTAAISATASTAAREEALNVYNLATALDPALISLSRSCPFFEGRATGLAVRTVHYRGHASFEWEGVYTELPQVGALLPYAEDSEHLIRQQFDRYEAWLTAMDRAGVERRYFAEAGGDLLRPAWNPVRLNRQGTLELRGMDSNYPEVTLTAAAMILGTAERVRREGLRVVPDKGVRTFEVAKDVLRVPDFDLLNGELLQAAVTGGMQDEAVAAYLDSILDLAGEDERLARLRRQRLSTGIYPTTEAAILEDYDGGRLFEEEGLRLVLEACDELEEQVSRLSSSPRQKEEPADIS